MKQPKRVTMQDVARVAGVSRPIASAILNGKTTLRYSESTRDHVLETAAKLGYRRNRSALNFLQKRHGVIDVITNSIYDMPHEMLSGMLAAAKATDQVLNLSQVEGKSHKGKGLRCLYEDISDAIILVANSDEGLDDKIDALGLPVVRINCNRQRENGCIRYDEAKAMERVVENLFAQNRRRLVFLETNRKHYSHSFRLDVLREAIRRRGGGIEVDAPEVRDIPEEFAADLKDYLDADAYLLHNNEVPELYNQLRLAGRTVGEEVSVMCMHHERLAGIMNPPCPGFRQQHHQIGILAVKTVDRMIKGEVIPSVTLPYGEILL